MNYQRNLTNRLQEALKASPIVLLTGARQTGKTTLIKQLASELGFDYLTFDSLSLLSAAQHDPMGFINGLAWPAVLDEVQRVPELALPIKMQVDSINKLGMYALTGSANPLALPALNDSLAGRMMILHLYPLSQGELHNKQETFIDDIFSAQWRPQSAAAWNREEMAEALVKGGYPRMQTLSPLMRQEWCNSHLITILERDAQDLAGMSRLKDLPRLMHLLALRASQTINMAEMSRLAGIPYATLHNYMSLLESVFLITRQPAWHSNKNKRLVKMPKLYLLDSGLLCYLIGVDEKRIVDDPTVGGAVLENFVVQELRKQSSWSSQWINLFHLRTSTGVEVDIVLENLQGKVVGVEVKSSLTIRQEDFKGLTLLAEECGDNFIRGFVVYPGSEIIPFGKNFFAIPITSIWQ